MIRRGAVELLDQGTPVDLLGEGEMFGHPSVLSGEPTRYGARAREDSLIYSLAADDVIPLLSRPSSLRFLARSLLARSRPGSPSGIDAPSAEVARQSAASLVHRPPVIVEPDATLRDGGAQDGG